MSHERTAVYRCGNKRCRLYHQEFTGMTPADYSMAVGRGVSCKACFQPVYLVRLQLVKVEAK